MARIVRDFPNHWAPKVRCAVCGKMVDRVDVDFDLYADAYRVKVLCHGASDEMRLTAHEIEDMGKEGADQIKGQVGVAFVVLGIPEISTTQP